MLNKISNTATVDMLQNSSDALFLYESIYKPKFLIKGKNEASVPIITSDSNDTIQFGIWGILPQNYDDSWEKFQDNISTLETPLDSIAKEPWLNDAFKHRRCIIMATGYFEAKVLNQKLRNFYHCTREKEVFCFAGIYNVLDDGFITCSIVSKPNDSEQHILNTNRPIILDSCNSSKYLNAELTLHELYNGNLEIDQSSMMSFQVRKKFLKQKKI